MKRKAFRAGIWILAILVECLAFWGIPLMKEAEAAEKVRLEVFNPTGDIEVARLYAPRLANLNGKTICEVSDRLWQADRTFESVRKVLKERFPDCRIIPYGEFPYGSLKIDTDRIGEAVKKTGCQAVIIGNAG